jgi:hypothetical protein
MFYEKTNMVYADYTWTASADHDNPRVIGADDHTDLNRSEGNEVLYFINSLAVTWGWQNASLSSFQSLEKIIRNEVPSSMRTYAQIKSWIENQYRIV